MASQFWSGGEQDAVCGAIADAILAQGPVRDGVSRWRGGYEFRAAAVKTPDQISRTDVTRAAMAFLCAVETRFGRTLQAEDLEALHMRVHGSLERYVGLERLYANEPAPAGLR